MDTASYFNSAAGVSIDLLRGSQVLGDARGDVLIGVEEVNGSAFNDVLRGSGVGNTLLGGGGNDTLEGRAGADTLNGGSNSDIFVFKSGFGDDVIGDFTAGAGDAHDLIELGGIFGDFAAIQDAMLQVGPDVVITSGADSILIEDLEIAALLPTDFRFV